jgi:hypothetical protein
MFGVDVFIASVSAWVAGCCGGSSSLLVSTAAIQGFVDVCGWVVVWVVLRG